MTKIQIIIDDEKSLKALTCTGVQITSPTLSISDMYSYGGDCIHLDCTGIIYDESPQLASLPDELLLRIRDYNIDVEHQQAIKTTRKLKKKHRGLKWLIECDKKELKVLQKKVELYNKVLEEIIDKYPKVAAAVALKLGQLDAACYFSAKANEEENQQ